MLKQWLRLTLVLLTCSLLVACGRERRMAETALKSAEDAVASAGEDVGRYAAEQWKAVTDALAAAKDSFARKEYKAALASAQEIPQKVQDAAAAASVKKEELTKAWNDLSAGLQKTVDSIKSRVDTLSSSKKLPKGLDKAKFEEAKSELASTLQSWTEALEAYKTGALQDAVSKANAVKDKAKQIMQSLGMTEAEAAGGAAPATP